MTRYIFFTFTFQIERFIQKRDVDLSNYVFILLSHNTLLKPKRHSLRCHGFVIHALLLRMNNNVVDLCELCKECAIANEIDKENDKA